MPSSAFNVARMWHEACALRRLDQRRLDSSALTAAGIARLQPVRRCGSPAREAARRKQARRRCSPQGLTGTAVGATSADLIAEGSGQRSVHTGGEQIAESGRHQCAWNEGRARWVCGAHRPFRDPVHLCTNAP